MKLFLILLVFVLIILILILRPEKSKDNLLLSCKTSDAIYFDYMSSTRGISAIERIVNGDTLFLTVYVSRSATNKNRSEIDQLNTVSIPKGVNFIHYGKIIKEVDKMATCPKTYSGKEALESLKNDLK
jgi:hypothetical protein